jgi:hypothetical protein
LFNTANGFMGGAHPWDIDIIIKISGKNNYKNYLLILTLLSLW